MRSMKIHVLLLCLLFFGLFSFPRNVSAQCTVDIWSPYGEYANIGVGTSFPLYWKATGCGSGFSYTITIYDQYGGVIALSSGIMSSNITYTRLGIAAYPLGLHTATLTTSAGATDSTHYSIVGYAPYPTYPPYPLPTYYPESIEAEAGPARTVKVGEQVPFDGSASTSSNQITSFVWDFGDGETGYGKTTTHVYSRPGTFTAALTIIDKKGFTAKDTVVITVRNPNVPPVARINGDTVAKTNQKASFDGSGSKDDDGIIVVYNWNFGDGGSSSGILVDHVYTQKGSYTVTLTVIDNSGLSHSASSSILVQEPPKPPRAMLQTAQQASVGEGVILDGSGSSGPGLSYRWSFGDGTEGEGVNAMHVYSNVGSYVVTLTVTSEEGLSDTAQSSIMIKGKPLLSGGANLLMIAGIALILLLGLILLLVYFLKR